MQGPDAQAPVAVAPPSPAPSTPYWQHQYPQQGAGVNQWAVLGPQLMQAQPGQAQAQPALPLSPQQAMARRELELLGDQLVAAACPAPALAGVREYFATQREAFAAADQLNQRLPLLPAPTVVMSQVALEELLPAAGGSAAAQQAQQAAPHAGASGASGGATPVRGVQLDVGGEAESAGLCQQQQQQQPAGPADFLSRCHQGALPPVDPSSYRLPSLTKRQRDGDEEEAARRQEQEEARRRFEAALAGVNQPPPAPASAAADQQQQQRQQPAGGAPGASCSEGGGAAASADTAGGMCQAEEEGRHQEAVRVFCVERRAR